VFYANSAELMRVAKTGNFTLGSSTSTSSHTIYGKLGVGGAADSIVPLKVSGKILLTDCVQVQTGNNSSCGLQFGKQVDAANQCGYMWYNYTLDNTDSYVAIGIWGQHYSATPLRVYQDGDVELATNGNLTVGQTASSHTINGGVVLSSGGLAINSNSDITWCKRCKKLRIGMEPRNY
jgi:hypothetical protein